MFDPRPLVDIATAIGREAGALVQRMRASAVVSFDTKSTSTDVVTAADRASEQLVRTRLSELRPGEPVLGEEEGGDVVEGLTWVVDPIDGTVNYLYGIPWYSVSIAAQLDGESVAGAVFEPATGRMWTAARGHGAFLDGTPLRVSTTTDLSLSLLGYGFAYRPERRQRQADAWAGMATRVRDLRRAGAASLDLCSVASGRLDAYAEHGLGRWDWAAGGLIAAEAGAVVRLPGSSPELGEDATFACTPGVADEMYRALTESGFGKV
ncbi:inositol monophosphatase family protein [Lentzea sp. JNUCC 0626]|uniref:inositol monophosphatase family protein n=1 Tax=Lentzea sp. JNUCC 0626 TaxID=3367513 RepID=UPI0037493D01